MHAPTSSHEYVICLNAGYRPNAPLKHHVITERGTNESGVHSPYHYHPRYVDRQTLRHKCGVTGVHRHLHDSEGNELRDGQQDGEAPYKRDANLEVRNQ